MDEMTLPNFIVAGTKKAATTSLYEYLGQHPQIYMSRIKETKYFAYEPHNPAHVKSDRQKYPIRTLDAYQELFVDVTDEIAIGEASPLYISSLSALQQIYQAIPQVKLIFSLRNPVDRVYSAYIMRVRAGYESRSVEQAMAEDAEAFRERTYHKLLIPWYEHFPREQIKVVLFEDIKRDAVQVMQELYDFLGVDASFAPDVSRHHQIGGLPKNQSRQNIVNYLRRYRFLRFYLPKGLRMHFTEFARANLEKAPPLPDDIRQELAALFSEDIPALEEMIGRDLSVWGLDTVSKTKETAEVVSV